MPPTTASAGNGEAMGAVQAPTEESGPSATQPKIRVSDINQFISCAICTGYLINACTIKECLHSFCRSCIVQYLENQKGNEKQCPVCDCKLSSTRPLADICPDQGRQDLVYALVPGLFADEMARRRGFYGEKKDLKPVDVEDAGLRKNLEFFQPSDRISLSIELHDAEDLRNSAKDKAEDACSSATSVTSDSSGNENDQNAGNQKDSVASGGDNWLPEKRYIEGPANMPIGCLRKFLVRKYGIGSQYRVVVMYSGIRLKDDFTLMEVAQTYTWRKTEPMRFTFQVLEKSDKDDAGGLEVSLSRTDASTPSQSKDAKTKEVKKSPSGSSSNASQGQGGSAGSGSKAPSSTKLPLNKPLEVITKPTKTNRELETLSPRSRISPRTATVAKRSPPIRESISPEPAKRPKVDKPVKKHSPQFDSLSVSSSKNASVTKLRQDNLTDAKFLAIQARAKAKAEQARKLQTQQARPQSSVPATNGPTFKFKAPSQSNASSGLAVAAKPASATSHHNSTYKPSGGASSAISSGNAKAADPNPLSPPPLRIKFTTSPNGSPDGRVPYAQIISPPPDEIFDEKSSKKSAFGKSTSVSSEPRFKTVTSQGVQSNLPPKHSGSSGVKIRLPGEKIHEVIDKMQSKGCLKTVSVSVSSTTNLSELSLAPSSVSSKSPSPAPSSPQHPSSTSTVTGATAPSPASCDEEVSTTTKDSSTSGKSSGGSLVVRISTKNGVSSTPSISSPSISESSKKSDDSKPATPVQDGDGKTGEKVVSKTCEDSADEEDEGNLIIVDEDESSREQTDGGSKEVVTTALDKSKAKLGSDVEISVVPKKPSVDAKPPLVSGKAVSVSKHSTSSSNSISDSFSWLNELSNGLSKDSPLSVSKMVSAPTNKTSTSSPSLSAGQKRPSSNGFPNANGSSKGGMRSITDLLSQLLPTSQTSKALSPQQIERLASDAKAFFPIQQQATKSPPHTPLVPPPNPLSPPLSSLYPALAGYNYVQQQQQAMVMQALMQHFQQLQNSAAVSAAASSNKSSPSRTSGSTMTTSKISPSTFSSSVAALARLPGAEYLFGNGRTSNGLSGQGSDKKKAKLSTPLGQLGPQ